MKNQDTACRTLSGERLASIRSIRYVSSAESPVGGLGALEIETKTGRFVHLGPGDRGECAIAIGPVSPPDAAAPGTRRWSDLTETVPFAFDNRPVVSRAEPVMRGTATAGCRIEFSTGGSFVYEMREGEPRLVCSSQPPAEPAPTVPPQPKYALPEIERRWLVDPEAAAQLHTHAPAIVHDRYIADTRLRLRRVREHDGGEVFKLCKKYGGKQSTQEYITNIYLTREEYRQFEGLPGTTVTKSRHPQATGAMDVYAGPAGPLHVFEVEFSSLDAAADYIPPDFVSREITEDPALTGHELALRYADDQQTGGPEQPG